MVDGDAARREFVANALRRARTALRLWRLYLLRVGLRLAPSEAQRLLLLTVLIGLVCGVAAVAFHLAIKFAEHALIDRAMALSGRARTFWTIATPTAGALVCGAFLEYVLPSARGSGIPQVKVAFAQRNGDVPLRDSIGKFFLGALQIGSGASLGREGPTVQICAGIAIALGRLARVSPRSLRRLLPVGAAAGVAAAFNAPIAAVTFTIEEIVGDLDKSVLSGVIVAAALAAVMERSALGEHAIFVVPHEHVSQHASSLLLYAALGVAAGFVSLAFTGSLLTLRKQFGALRAVPRWARPGLGGLITGLLAAAALSGLGVHGVTGGGYSTLSEALAGRLDVEVMLLLCTMKVVATVASYSSGGAGGIFAPSLFMGAMLGGAFGSLDVQLFAHQGDTVGSFALVGMGAVFAGSVRAPMTSVLIIIEMTDGYSLILPLMIANTTAYLIARQVRPTPIYDALLEQDGIRLRDRAVADVLEGLRVDGNFLPDGAFKCFDPTAHAGELMAAADAQEVFPVVESGKMIGMITREDLRTLRAEPALEALVNAADIMRAPASVGLRDDLHTALELMLANGIGRLPVLGDDEQIVGFVDEGVIAKAYLRGHTSRDE